MMNTAEMIAYFEKALVKYVPAIKDNGYKKKSSEINNPDDPDLIWNQLIYKSFWKGREIYIDFSPRPMMTLSMFFYSKSSDECFCDLNEYLQYKEMGQPVVYAEGFQIDRNCFEDSLKDCLTFIQGLFEGELKDVIKGKVIIEPPSLDPRDALCGTGLD